MTMQNTEAKTNTREDVKFTIDYLHNYMRECEERLGGVREELSEVKKTREEANRGRREFARRLSDENSGMSAEELLEAKKGVADLSTINMLYEREERLNTLEKRYLVAENQASIAATLIVMKDTPKIFTLSPRGKRYKAMFREVLKEALEPLYVETITNGDGEEYDRYKVSVYTSVTDSGYISLHSYADGKSAVVHIGEDLKSGMDTINIYYRCNKLLSMDGIVKQVEDAYLDRATMKERYNALKEEIDDYNYKYMDLDGFEINMPYIY